MKIWPFKKKGAVTAAPVLTPNPGTFTGIIREPFAGAWQRGISYKSAHIYQNPAVFACISLISGDIGKLKPNLQNQWRGIWQNAPVNAPVLEKPNGFQTRNEFFAAWVAQLLAHGNAYIIKRGGEWRLLNPQKVQAMVSNDGAVFYNLGVDDIAGITEAVTVPERSLIHHRINAWFHPLLGLSPLYAAAISGEFGEAARQAALSEYENQARPGGIIEVPGSVPVDKLAMIKATWSSSYGGENRGKTAVLADGMTFKEIGINSLADAELINALKLTTEQICACFGVFPWMIGAASQPNYNGSNTGQQLYFTRTLQRYIEEIESLLFDALELTADQRVNFDVSGLLRMTPAEQMAVLASGINASILSPNEARAQLNLPPVAGGDQPLSQQQYYSLAELAKRKTAPAPLPAATVPEEVQQPAANDAADDENDNAA